MLRVVSINLNGARAAFRKGLGRWLQSAKPDILCAQELKARAADLSEDILAPAGLRGHFAFAERPGYSGVGVYCRRQPLAAQTGLGRREWDSEGRWLRLDFAHISVVSLYLPSGSSGETRQAYKERMMKAAATRLQRYQKESAQTGRQFVLCGDFNIAHTPNDIRNWRGNQKNSGFLPHEREWYGRQLARGWVDVFRRLQTGDGHYTWWSNRGRAWENNVGWRIDCQWATAGLAATARRAKIYRARRFSDHAPLVIDYAARA